MNNVVRFGVSIDDKLLKKFDNVIEDKGYVNRSEAIRDLIRDLLVKEETSEPDMEVIGTLTLIYSHHESEIPEKLNDIQHSYHLNIISTVHVHLDEHNCLEVLLLRGLENGPEHRRSPSLGGTPRQAHGYLHGQEPPLTARDYPPRNCAIGRKSPSTPR